MDINFRLFEEDHDACIDNLRMDMNCFNELCQILQTSAGLYDNKYVTIKEQVGIFLLIIAHNKKRTGLFTLIVCVLEKQLASTSISC